MPTLNVLLDIYGKKTYNLFKRTNIPLLFRSFINEKSNHKVT